MSAITAIFADATKVTATVREKRPDGSVITAKLNRGPSDMSEQAFADAAAEGGATFSEKAGDAERSRSRSRKDVVGKLASAGVMEILGLASPVAGTTPPPADVPPAVKNRGKSVMATANGSANGSAH